jgi:hypothetical protein
MVILQVNYTYTGISRATWETRYTDETATKFLAVDGLAWKIWLDAPDEPRVGGIYLFETMAQAQAYLDGPIVARLKGNPAIENLETRLFNVRERMTAITNGPVPGLALAAE